VYPSFDERRLNGWLGFWWRISLQKRKRIVLFALAVFVVLLVLWSARSVLGLYIIGLVLAYLLSPIVDAIQRGIDWVGNKVHLGFLSRISRSASIILSYLLLIALAAGFVSMVVPIVVREAVQLWETREKIWGQASTWFDLIVEQYELLPERVRMEIDDTLRDLSSFLMRAMQQAIQGTFTAISYTTSVVLAITIVPFWTYFLLRDFDSIQASLYRTLPHRFRDDVHSILSMLDHTIGGYLRGEIVLMLVVGVMNTIALTLLGLDYALLLGVIAGLLEIVPNIGPTLAAIPAVIVALTRSPGLALLTALVANLIQNIENSLIVPRVLGQSVGLHPVVMMVMLVVGAEIAGLPGLILAPILTAMLRDVFRYLSFRFADKPASPEEALKQVLAGGEFSMDL
jgi:predicted PurR-regulated permease PerM